MPIGLLLLATCKSVDHSPTPLLAEGRKGMVSSAYPLATRAGLGILRAGGNAFDAAVAIAAALNVTEPMMSGMGGYGTILVYDAKAARVRYLDSSGRIPKAVDSDVYRSPTPGYLENRRGAKAVSTPGNVMAWGSLSKLYGTLDWSDLFAPAIRLADHGFRIDGRTAGLIARAYGDFSETAQKIYGREGRPLRAGERLIQKDLASSLALIAANGTAAFYTGPLSRIIDRAMTCRVAFSPPRTCVHIAPNGGTRSTSTIVASRYTCLHRRPTRSRR